MDSRKVYAFLSVGWGILADIDIESEVIRSIGESRFTLWSLLRIAKLKTYNARLSYTLLDNNKDKGGKGRAGDENENTRTETVIEGDFVSVYASCQSHIGSDIIFAPDAIANDQLIHLTYIRGDVGRARITQFLLGLDTGTEDSSKNNGICSLCCRNSVTAHYDNCFEFGHFNWSFCFYFKNTVLQQGVGLIIFEYDLP